MTSQNIQINSLHVLLFVHIAEGPVRFDFSLFLCRLGCCQNLLLQLLAECHGRLVVILGRPALRSEADLAEPLTLVRVFQCGIQLHGFAYVLIVEYDWTWRTSFCKRLPALRRLYKVKAQL